MSTTQPIRDRKVLQDFKNYYLYEEYNPRNYALIVIGLNTALRISDILHIKWEMVFSSKPLCFKSHIIVKEEKTGKENRIFLNPEVERVLTYYYEFSDKKLTGYILQGKNGSSSPLSRCQAYRIIKRAAERVGLEDIIRCHSLRKTFGYHAWKQGTPPALLMSIFNHSSYQITKRYLCIEQDDKDEVFSKIQL